jgi:hypothetical protein
LFNGRHPVLAACHHHSSSPVQPAQERLSNNNVQISCSVAESSHCIEQYFTQLGVDSLTGFDVQIESARAGLEGAR